MHIPTRSVQTHGPGHRRSQMLLEFVIFILLLCWVLSKVQSGCGWGCGCIFLPAPHVQSIREANAPFALEKSLIFVFILFFICLIQAAHSDVTTGRGVETMNQRDLPRFDQGRSCCYKCIWGSYLMSTHTLKITTFLPLNSQEKGWPCS